MAVVTKSIIPFALSDRIDPELESVRRYWTTLRRSKNAIPFADDLNLEQLKQFEPRLMVLEVRERPQRFRIAIVGGQIEKRFKAELADWFIDELAPNPPLEYLASQCCAVMQSSAPAWFACEDGERGYERLLLPMWGNGYVSTILAVYAWHG